MPQCAKCGREISQYGVCEHCSKKITDTKRTPYCPKCRSRYCKRISDGTYKCSMCGEIFVLA